MEMTEFPGPLYVNFQDDKLVGWFLQDSGKVNPVRLSQGLGVENTVSDLSVAFDSVELIENTALGNEFTTSDGIGGFLDERGIGIDAFYAGTNCFFR